MTSKKQINAKEVSRVKSDSSGFEFVKWFGFAVAFVAGIYANMHFSAVAWSIRAAIGIIWFAFLLAIVATTNKGKKAWGFVKSSRAELRRVVWPTRQETLQTTLIVIVVVLICALVLWGLDTLFVWLIGWLVGQRG